jgi:class 3 adenylate cyclase/pimeloyl-ACP methyl ester carboxylesterase
MDREVRYCTAEDGVRIAYCVEGEGPPLLISPFIIEAFSLCHLFPAYEQFIRDVSNGYTAIRFDQRGSGLSEHVAENVTVGDFARDAAAVIEATGVQRHIALGLGSGSQVFIEYARKHPERISRLIVYGAFPGLKRLWSVEMGTSFASLCRANWPMAIRALGDQSVRDIDAAMADQLGVLLERSVSGEMMARVIEQNLDIDLAPVLPEIKVPTLVIHRIGDSIVPFANGQLIATGIPGARFVPVPGSSNHPAVGDPQPILNAIHSFLDEDPETRRRLPAEAADQHAGAFRTVLFTDLVGHTAMMRRLGDERGRAVLREHERITRDVLKAHGGAEVKTMGDGFMASFGSVTKAVECGIALQQAFAERNEGADEPLAIRVGLNAGEPIEEDGDLFGETVILAARIAGMAQGGEVLASLAVRELCAGKGFAFADLGEHAMRGFEDPVRVFEIRRPV